MCYSWLLALMLGMDINFDWLLTTLTNIALVWVFGLGGQHTHTRWLGHDRQTLNRQQTWAVKISIKGERESIRWHDSQTLPLLHFVCQSHNVDFLWRTHCLDDIICVTHTHTHTSICLIIISYKFSESDWAHYWHCLLISFVCLFVWSELKMTRSSLA